MCVSAQRITALLYILLDFIIQVIQISEGGNKVEELTTSDERIVFSIVRPFCRIITINVHTACVLISSFFFFFFFDIWL